MRKSLIVLLTVVLFASCTPPDVPTTGGETPDLPTYVIGDFYQKGNVEGVVFQTNAGGAHGKLVSLDESRAVWCDNLHAPMSPPRPLIAITAGAMPISSGTISTCWDFLLLGGVWRKTTFPLASSSPLSIGMCQLPTSYVRSCSITTS